MAASLGAYVLLGVATTMLGPLLPLLQKHWMLADSQAGALFIGQFLGGFAGGIASGEITRWSTPRLTSRFGLLLIAAGFVALAWGQLWMSVAAIALYGFGIGLAMPAITLTVVELSGEQSTRALNLLNFCWALGAIVAPGVFLRIVAGDLGKLRTTLLASSVALTAASCFLPAIAARPAAPLENPLHIGREDLRKVLSCAMLIFAYVGLENGIAGWMPSLAQRVAGFPAGKVALLQTLFWTSFLLGRMLTSMLIRPGAERRLLSFTLIAATAGTALLLSSREEPLVFAAGLLLGAGMAPVFPTAVSLLSAKVSDEWRPRLGWVFAAGGLGGAVLPYAIGALSSAASSLRTGMSLCFVAEAVLFATLVDTKRW